MKVSVIIVSYNARFYLEQCLHSVLKALKTIESEVIVFDNDSPEKPIAEIKSKFPTVQFIESKENLGFGRANNAAVEKAKGEFVLILNPDTLVPENLFEKILVFADSKPDLGALAVRMIDADGRFHPESKRNIPDFKNTFGKLFGSFFNSSQSNSYYKTEVDEFEVAPIEILCGALMLLRREVYLKAGGFDPAYFMYGEDIDLSYTLILNGYSNYYFGGANIIHYKGESTRKDKKYLKVFFEAMQIFVDKYYSKKHIQHFGFSIGLKARYFLAQSIGYFKKGDLAEKRPVSVESLQKINSTSEIIENSKHILLDGSVFSNLEMIEIISKYSLTNRHFYIKPKEMSVIIGDSGVTEI